jgi:NAD(P)-dependent dehydrogenase (short-subunit alcohol dehydrogenase family)
MPVDDTLTAHFSDKVALVTGGASGIGRAFAAALHAAGASVVVADLDAAGAEAVAAGLTGGPSAVAAELDVTDAAAVRALVESTARDRGRLDFCFNNAGIGAGGPVERLALDDWRRVIDVDLMGVVHGVAAAYPIMVRQGSGHLVNTASLAGLVPSPFLTPYAAAKAGVVGLSQSLRVEAAAHGVNVTVVCPGPVETPLLDAGQGAGPAGDDRGGSVGTPMNVRKLLTNALGEPYAPEALADDVLRAVVDNEPFVVAPESARAVWKAFRQDPLALLDVMVDQAVAARERRESGD